MWKNKQFEMWKQIRLSKKLKKKKMSTTVWTNSSFKFHKGWQLSHVMCKR